MEQMSLLKKPRRLLDNPSVISSLDDVLFNSLDRFYTPKYLQMLHDITKSSKPVSLRKLENYVKEHHASEYEAQLNSFSKAYFDPFKRGPKLKFEKGGIKVVTTLGQLNYFRWIFRTGIINKLWSQPPPKTTTRKEKPKTSECKVMPMSGVHTFR
jgi:hypothetical protein